MTTTAARLRREGMADAAVHLVASRFQPHCDLEDWARALGLQQPEVRAAIARFREKHRAMGAQRPALHVVPDRKPHPNAGRKRVPDPERAKRDERIRAMRAEGFTLGQIAAETGVSVGRASVIARASA